VKSYAELEGYLAHTFRDPALLQRALTHRSYAHEQKQPGIDNEKLEFLGDSVLDLIVTHVLLEKNPSFSEGELSALRSHLVNEQSLATMAKRIDLGTYLLLGKGEEASGGREKTSLLSNAYEAIIGALYSELGFAKTLSLVQRLWHPIFESVTASVLEDYKSLFQEQIQAKFHVHPSYSVLSEEGPPHQKIFEIGVFVGSSLMAKATGRSKREAEQKAAKEALSHLDP